MRINIFTAPAIGLYLNKLRQNGKGEAAVEYITDVDNAFKKQWHRSGKLYQNAESFSTTEFAGTLGLMFTEGGFLGLEIIRLIFVAGEAAEKITGCIKKGVKNSKK